MANESERTAVTVESITEQLCAAYDDGLAAGKPGVPRKVIVTDPLDTDVNI